MKEPLFTRKQNAARLRVINHVFIIKVTAYKSYICWHMMNFVKIYEGDQYIYFPYKFVDLYIPLMIIYDKCSHIF